MVHRFAPQARSLGRKRIVIIRNLVGTIGAINMSKVCLQQQLTCQANEVELLIKELPPNDPMKDWYFFELDSLTTGKLAENRSLDEENARLRGLQQLRHLVQKHRVRLGLPDMAPSGESHLEYEWRLRRSAPGCGRWRLNSARWQRN